MVSSASPATSNQTTTRKMTLNATCLAEMIKQLCVVVLTVIVSINSITPKILRNLGISFTFLGVVPVILPKKRKTKEGVKIKMQRGVADISAANLKIRINGNVCRQSQ